MAEQITDRSQPVSGERYREVLGRYPTGVTLITAGGKDGPHGIVIGSFVSVSLDPPLVGFLPGKGSWTWPLIEETGVFYVNILADNQKWVADSFFRKEDNPWMSVSLRWAASGAPIIDGCLAGIDCSIDRVVDVGDHWFVIGEVKDVECSKSGSPLLFLGGSYGRLEGGI